MPTTKKYKSATAAAETLRRFFADSPDSDEVTVEEIFKVTGREQKAFKANMAWLSNKLTTLRYHNLVNASYSYQGRRRLEGLSLTLDGKRAIGRAQAIAGSSSNLSSVNSGETPDNPSIEGVLALVSQLRRDFPEFDIALTVKSKDKT